MVIPGDPESSNLMLLLDWRASPELRMPHGKKQLNRATVTLSAPVSARAQGQLSGLDSAYREAVAVY